MTISISAIVTHYMKSMVFWILSRDKIGVLITSLQTHIPVITCHCVYNLLTFCLDVIKCWLLYVQCWSVLKSRTFWMGTAVDLKTLGERFEKSILFHGIIVQILTQWQVEITVGSVFSAGFYCRMLLSAGFTQVRTAFHFCGVWVFNRGVFGSVWVRSVLFWVRSVLFWVRLGPFCIILGPFCIILGPFGIFWLRLCFHNIHPKFC